MSYIGNPIISTDFPKDTFSGNGSTTAFTMSIAPASVNAVIVVVSGITQDPSTYTISGTTLTFSAAPPTGTSNISVRHLGVAGIPNTPSDASVTTAKLGSITNINSASSLALQTNNGTTAVTIDASQNVGIGTASPSSKLHVYGATNSQLTLQNSNNSAYVGNISGSMEIQSADIIKFNTAGATERMRIDTSGNLLVGCTAAPSASVKGTSISADVINIAPNKVSAGSGTGLTYLWAFLNGNGQVGSISVNGSSTSYTTSSDYRLKENITPMQNALNVVQQLKPVTYNWKSDGSEGQGFIAHELAEVVSGCVTGAKDAVETYTDEDGNEQTRPIYQGIDTSFLVATLTAAIQELNAKVDAQALEIQALKGTV